MATNHDITTTHVEHRQHVSGDATAGLAVIAFLLALVLGFSAADIHRQAPNSGLEAGAGDIQPVLDGRGKWAGYF